MYWCFHCYAVNDHPTGPCDACGQPVEAPAGLSYVDGLTWALHHPDGDRAVIAAQTLGRLRAREATPALRAVAAEHHADIYVREAALCSVIAIEGSGPLRQWLEELSRSAPFNVRAIAQQALQAALAPGRKRILGTCGSAWLPSVHLNASLMTGRSDIVLLSAHPQARPGSFRDRGDGRPA